MADNIAELVKALKAEPSNPNTKYSAIVSHVDSEGTVWVYVAGSDIETPTASTATEVNSGDAVTVEWRNNKLYIAGNYSNPSAGTARVTQVETVANNAQSAASVAYTAANNAVADAARASTAANEAESHAQTALTNAGLAQTAANQASQAATAAQGSADAASAAAAVADGKAVQASQAAAAAQTSANEAKASAYNANEYATRALGNLATVESVAETLAWVTEHGTMTLTSDVALDPTHVYFVRDNNGDYQVGSYRYSLVIEPDVDDISTYYELTIDESLNNYVGTHLALTDEGLWLLPATSGTHKVLIAVGGSGHTYSTAGTYIIDSTGGIVASFRADGATIGENLSGKSRTEINADGMQIYRKNSGTDIELANIGYGSGNAVSGTAVAPYYTFGNRLNGSTVGNWSFSEGNNTTASGYASHAEGDGSIASGYASHAEGSSIEVDGVKQYTTASGDGSHAEGIGTTASMGSSHAEGLLNVASGYASHAEGEYSTASDDASHAEGIHTTASGDGSHAEGIYTTASGAYSHAQNNHTIAASENQTALGRYNVEDNQGVYAVIVGHGTSSVPKNIYTIDWDGNVDIASGAKYKINGANLSASDVGGVPTTRTVNGKALSSDINLGAADISGLIDMFYPVGSYYETSDTTFDPNTAWGGTWSLETAGQVHVSAGSGYTIGSTGGATTKSYTPAGSIGDTKLSDAQIAHGHGHSLTLPNHTHSMSHTHGTDNSTYERFVVTASSGTGIARRTIKNGTSTEYANMMYSDNVVARLENTGAPSNTNTGNPSSNPSVGGSVSNLSGASSTRTAHGHSWTGTSANINVMQPYIVVNRWHRTA